MTVTSSFLRLPIRSAIKRRFGDRFLGIGLSADGTVPGLNNAFTFARNSKAWDYNASGDLTEYAADAIRQGYDPSTLLPAGYLLEGATTNLATNPRAEYSTTPTFPTTALPLHWTGTTTTLTPTVIGTGVEDDIPYADIQFSGTPSGTNPQTLTHASSVAAVAGDAYTNSVWCRLVSGSFTNTSTFTLRAGAEAGGTSFTPDAVWRRITNTRTLTSTNAVGTLRYNFSNTTTPVSFVLRVGGWMCEKQPYATTIVMPAVGTRASSSRDADTLTVLGDKFTSVFGAGARQGWLIADVMLPQNAGPNAACIFQIDDGSDSNRFLLRCLANSATLNGFKVTGGVGSSGVLVGTMTPGTAFRVGMRWSAGTVDWCLGGAALARHTDGPTGGLTQLSLGREISATSPLNGRIQGVWASQNGALSDSKFQAACVYGADIAAAIA